MVKENSKCDIFTQIVEIIVVGTAALVIANVQVLCQERYPLNGTGTIQKIK